MFDFNSLLANPAQLLIIPAALLAIMLHEISHGLIAYRLGDPTAKQSGRLSLNPIRHIDPIGLLAMIIVRFGWAKPVPVDMRYFRKPRRDFALVALAGPVSNFLQSFVGCLLLNSAFLLSPVRVSSGLYNTELILYQYPLHLFLYLYVSLNVTLGVFNLIPIPPLDGSKIVGIVIPDRFYYPMLRYERYGMIALVILLYTGLLDGPRTFLTELFMGGVSWLAALPFQLFGAFGS